MQRNVKRRMCFDETVEERCEILYYYRNINLAETMYCMRNFNINFNRNIYFNLCNVNVSVERLKFFDIFNLAIIILLLIALKFLK